MNESMWAKKQKNKKPKKKKNKNKNKNKTKKPLFPKFQLIPILRFWVMHDYVCFIAPIDYWPVSHSARHQRPARERHNIRVASRENVDNQAPRNTNFTH